MHEKSGPRVHIQNTTLPKVEYEIQEALNGTSIDRNQDQRRKGRSFAQCPKSRMKPHVAVRLLRNLSNGALRFEIKSCAQGIGFPPLPEQFILLFGDGNVIQVVTGLWDYLGARRCSSLTMSHPRVS